LAHIEFKKASFIQQILANFMGETQFMAAKETGFL
jgi:hypothetical protein